MELYDAIKDDVRSRDNIRSRENWNRIKIDDPALTALRVCLAPDHPGNGPIIEDAEIGELGRDIGRNTSLRKLEFNGRVPNMTLASRRFPEGDIDEARRLFLSNGLQLSKETFQLLSPILENNNTLQYLSLCYCNIGREEIRWLATSLAKREIPLDDLHLPCNRIDDDSVRELIMAFHENPGFFPKKLSLSFNSIGQNGCDLIAHLLQDPMCPMEELNLQANRDINDAAAIVLANALVGNRTLNKLDLASTGVTITGFDSFLRTICDTSTIKTTYASNHTLQYLHFRPPDLRQHLELNRNNDKKAVARHKVLMHHFSGDINMQPFEEMTQDLLLGSVNFIDKWGRENDRASYDIARRSILYQLIKSDPMLCQIEKSRLVENGNPRK